MSLDAHVRRLSFGVSGECGGEEIGGGDWGDRSWGKGGKSANWVREQQRPKLWVVGSG